MVYTISDSPPIHEQRGPWAVEAEEFLRLFPTMFLSFLMSLAGPAEGLRGQTNTPVRGATGVFANVCYVRSRPAHLHRFPDFIE